MLFFHYINYTYHKNFWKYGVKIALRKNIFSFKKGIHPKENKHYTSNGGIQFFAGAKTYSIPALQHIGEPAEAIVQAGDAVLVGQCLALSGDGCGIYSSVSGTVTGIAPAPNANGQRCEHILIESDGQYSFINNGLKDADDDMRSVLSARRNAGQMREALLLDIKKTLSRGEIYNALKAGGVVGMGGAGFPTHRKYPENINLTTLIINGAECEPYITCDHKIMRHAADKIIAAALVIAKAYNIGNVIFATEDNKQDVAEIVGQITKDLPIKVVLVKTKYPQGAERQLINAVTDKCVPCNCLPHSVGCVVNNVHTLFSAYYALFYGLPSYSRLVTVSGDAVKNPSDVFVPMGVSFEDVLNFCGGIENAKKVLNGGPMMGHALSRANVSVTKTTSCILALTENAVNTQMAYPCINCGRCARACPYHLMPMFVDSKTIAKDYESAKKYGAIECVECGCCAYVCPSKRPLVQNIRLAKKIIKRYDL